MVQRQLSQRTDPVRMDGVVNITIVLLGTMQNQLWQRLGPAPTGGVVNIIIVLKTKMFWIMMKQVMSIQNHSVTVE